jgi:pimeloyl-ACP methyl ester carboxylesterase
MSQIFLIPGLGADHRVYKNIKLKNTEITYIDWIEPSSTDTLTTYAQRLINEYHISPGSIVIGNSLGGMLAVEIANKIALEKVILISSIKTIDEAPFYFHIFRWLPIYKLIPGSTFIRMGKLIAPLMGKMYSLDAYLFNSMLEKTSPVFFKWAMWAILHWTNKTVPPNLHHITGNKDLLFNYKRIKGATIIEGGTHIMILDRAREITLLLNDILKQS